MPPFEKRACFCRIRCVFQQLVPRIRRGESGRAELGPLSPFVITPPTEVRAFPAWVERLRLTPHPPPLDRRLRRPLGFLPLRLPTFQRYSGRRGWFVAPLASSMSFPTVPSDVRRVGRLSVGSGAVRNSLAVSDTRSSRRGVTGRAALFVPRGRLDLGQRFAVKSAAELRCRGG